MTVDYRGINKDVNVFRGKREKEKRVSDLRLIKYTFFKKMFDTRKRR